MDRTKTSEVSTTDQSGFEPDEGVSEWRFGVIQSGQLDARPLGMTKHAPPVRKVDANNFGGARFVVTGSTD
ncbi:MAG: hypothetical protein HS122_07675 [Opitutaceae bacterium]|nr:hypothetical protein [Opitutaceae bacterium]